MPSVDDMTPFSNGDKKVLRPLRLDVYTVYTPFKMDWLRLSLKPSLGFSLLTVYDTMCFNAGLRTEFKLVNMFGLTWDFRYREQIWLNKLDLMLNFRALELDFGIGFRSLNFPDVFAAKGFFASCGFRLGF
jgi:hypothetical protein